MPKPQEHWDQVYSTKSDTEVSWHQPRPKRSLGLIRSATPNLDASIIDVGGGTSHLVDELLSVGYFDLTVLDVSQAALDRSKARLGGAGKNVSWIAADITTWTPPRSWDVWHDRALFHFLTETKDQDAYISVLRIGTKHGSVAIIATFALDGPERCSGLPVQRYSSTTLAVRIGGEFELVADGLETHRTPWGSIQNFTYVVLKRR